MITKAATGALISLVLCFVVFNSALGADLVALSPQTWDRYIPEGKEVDGVYGDFALANDQIMSVIAFPKRERNANMTVRGVGGCLIDLTRRDRQSDQLSAFHPGGQLRELRFGGIDVSSPEVYEADPLDRVFVRARRVTLRLIALPRAHEPDVEVSYALEDGWPYLLVTTVFANRGPTPIDVDLLDSIRADRSFEMSPEGASDLFWAYDRHFGQAYGVVTVGQILGVNARQMQLRYLDRQGKAAHRLGPNEVYRHARWIFPGADLFEVRQIANRFRGLKEHRLQVTVNDASAHAVVDADVTLARGGKPEAWGRTDARGQVVLDVGEAPGSLSVSAVGRGARSISLTPPVPATLTVEMPDAAAVVARITNEQGGPTPCKVQFIGKGVTKSPDFGPDSGECAIKNVYYSHDGRFRRELEPGTYDVIVSYGPEHDAVFTSLEVAQGKEPILEAKLVRSVKTDGWISTDFHSHSTPSGDNTSSQLGRVLNLLCEHIEFAPCTEHNRLSTYDPHLKRLGAERLMATCVGIELTGNPLPLNHQNAFPLVLRPNIQDNGGPTPDNDPAIQIERLAMWDAGSEKLVQVNHPDIGWMFRDRDGNGVPDAGFGPMLGRMDVIEVHPPASIFGATTVQYDGKTYNNTIVNWLQLLNQGRRIPGVVNTDAHYNFHGSGWLRNYVKSPTDNPAEIKTLDVVHATERGHLVMSNGPFLEVKLVTSGESAKQAIPGDDLATPSGTLTLEVRVQCPNWFDVDRVQVFLNGRPDKSLNFTRARAPDKFSVGMLKFDQKISLRLDRDTHVIVAAIGEQSKLGPVMGPEHAADLPVAISNPIFVDVDGGGFKHNGDTLGVLPLKSSN
jgi:hypothetical protein